MGRNLLLLGWTWCSGENKGDDILYTYLVVGQTVTGLGFAKRFGFLYVCNRAKSMAVVLKVLFYDLYIPKVVCHGQSPTKTNKRIIVLAPLVLPLFS